MIFHTLDDLENYFHQMGFNVLHFTHNLVVDTYILVINSNYDVKDRLYIEINYTTGRDSKYELIYLPLITDVYSCPEDKALDFEMNPKDHMSDLECITSNFDFENIPDELANQFTTEFELYLNYIRQESDLNFKKCVAEKKQYDAKIRKLLIENLNILDDLFNGYDFEEVENPFGYKNPDEVVLKAAQYKSKSGNVLTVIVNVYDSGKYKYRIRNASGGNLHSSVKIPDRNVFVSDFQKNFLQF